MNVVRIPLSEFAKTDDVPQWGVSYPYWRIYKFYETHSLNDYYQIIYDSASDRDEAVPLEYLRLFESYGISFGSKISAVQTKKYFTVIPIGCTATDEEFDEAVRNRIREFDDEDVGFVIVDFEEMEDLSEVPDAVKMLVASRIASVFPNAIIANKEISTFRSSYVQTKPVFKNSVNFDSVVAWNDLIIKNSTANIISSKMHLLLDVIDSVKACKAEFIDASESEFTERLTPFDKRSLAYICLMKYNKHLYFDSISNDLLYAEPQELMRCDAMYANEYLDMLANLPDAFVYHAAEPILLFPIHDGNEYENVQFQVSECIFDMNTFKVCGDAITQSYSYDQIELLSAADIFQLSSTNSDTALTGMQKFKDVIQQFTAIYGRTRDTTAILFDVSNLIFYRIGETCYMAYLAYVKAEKEFEAYTVRERSKPFTLKLDAAKIVMRDVRLCDDWKQVMAPYVRAGIVRKDHIFFKPQRYINGLLMRGIQLSGLTVPTDCGLTVEEAGMFAASSWPLRATKVLLDNLKHDFVMKNIATPFGGMHPMQCTSVNISREDWRSYDNRIQQFNTYRYQ